MGSGLTFLEPDGICNLEPDGICNLEPDGICNPVRKVWCLAAGFGVCTKRKRRGCKPIRANLSHKLLKKHGGSLKIRAFAEHGPAAPLS